MEAVELIPSGTELLISYLDRPVPRLAQARQRLLETTYLFACACPLCSPRPQDLGVLCLEALLCPACGTGAVPPSHGACLECGIVQSAKWVEAAVERVQVLDGKVS
jgi:ribosomal protein S27AE